MGCSLMPPGDCRLKGVSMVSSRKTCNPKYTQAKTTGGGGGETSAVMNLYPFVIVQNKVVFNLVNIQDLSFYTSIRLFVFLPFWLTMKTFTKTT